MTDTPSSILLLRLQSTGSNINLWGGYLNTALQTLEQAAKGYQALAVTGDATITWSYYSTGNTGQCGFLKLTGSLVSSATLTFPSYMNLLAVRNSSGAQVTIKCVSGTGVAIANGAYGLIYCDGVDYYNAAPTILPSDTTVSGALTVSGLIHGVAAAVSGTDAVNLTQMSAAIAGSVPVGTAGTFFNSVSDTTRGYNTGKNTMASDSLLTYTTQNSAANEYQELSDRRLRRRILFAGQV